MSLFYVNSTGHVNRVPSVKLENHPVTLRPAFVMCLISHGTATLQKRNAFKVIIAIRRDVR